MVENLNTVNKCYIKSYTINNSPQEWIANNFDNINKDNAIVGYIFKVVNDKQFNKVYVLNLYLINRLSYKGKEVDKLSLQNNWELFFVKVNQNIKNVNIFLNPPLELWLISKDNWLKKVSGIMSKSFNLSFDEAMEEIYYVITKLYVKSNVYLGSLDYIYNAVYSRLLHRYVHTKSQLNQDNNTIDIVSLSKTLSTGDNKDLLLEDTLEDDNVINRPGTDMQYNELLNASKDLLSKSFSDREIDQILSNPIGYWPSRLYVKVKKWRDKHTVKELCEYKRRDYEK